MKRLICIAAAFALALTSLCAEINPSSRFVEFGFDLDFSAGQNGFGLSDVMVKDLVIDFNELYEGLGKHDFMMNMEFAPGTHFMINVNGIGAGIKTDLDFAGNISIDNALFRLLAEGNEVNQAEEIGMSLNLELFLSISIPTRFKVGSLGIKVEPSYFLPLLYLPNPRASLTYTMSEDGSMKVDGLADFDLYSAVDVSPLFSDSGLDFSDLDFTKIPSQLKNGGIDIAAQVEYPILDSLDIGAYTSIPVMPGKLNYHSYGTATFSAESQGFLDYYTSTDEDKGEAPYSYSGPDWSGVQFDENGYKVNRPFRLGVEAAWRPVGNWFTLHPRLGLAARNPFGDDFSFSSMYPEYSITADMTFLYVLGLSATTSYENQAFSHNVGLRLNARILELDLSVGTSNSDFRKSFALGGLQTRLGVKMGF